MSITAELHIYLCLQTVILILIIEHIFSTLTVMVADVHILITSMCNT